MNCKVLIDGAEDAGKVVSEGDLTVDERGFTLAYTIDGDNCLLTGRGGTVTQSRRGSLNTDATFVKGRRTAFVLSGGELSGEIPLITRSMEVSVQGGLKLNIEYELGGAKINLRLTADYI